MKRAQADVLAAAAFERELFADQAHKISARQHAINILIAKPGGLHPHSLLTLEVFTSALLPSRDLHFHFHVWNRFPFPWQRATSSAVD